VLLCATVVLPVGLGAAIEQARVKKAPESYEEIDTNGDGFIDAKEAWGMAYYANSQQVQGLVTAEQIVAYLDKNGDGKISKDEASAELKPHFDKSTQTQTHDRRQGSSGDG
jgi:hypothetical protein